MNIIFITSISILIYTYIGYPLIISLISLIAENKHIKDSSYTPFVTFIIPAYNEEDCIQKKIENALLQDYPKSNLEIILTSDASSDRTIEIARKIKCDNLKIIDNKIRSGKMGIVSNAIKIAKGEIIVLTDANCMYAKNTIRELVSNFADSNIGCVCGSKVITSSIENNKTENEERNYWQYESFIKYSESKTGSCVGADGSVYAVRRNLFPEVPLDRLVMDDLIVSLMIVQKGFRCVYDPLAKAFEESAQSTSTEFKRKARILAGAISVIFYLPKLLISPFAFKVVSHKILRWMTFIFMMSAFISSFYLKETSIFNTIFITQAMFYFIAFLGFIADKLNLKVNILQIPYYFTLVTFAQMWGIFVFYKSRRQAHWEKMRN